MFARRGTADDGLTQKVYQTKSSIWVFHFLNGNCLSVAGGAGETRPCAFSVHSETSILTEADFDSDARAYGTAVRTKRREHLPILHLRQSLLY